MRSFLIAIFGSLMNWWGLSLIAALDSTIIFVIPLAIDIAVIVLSSRGHLFWIYPLIATAGSLVGAAITYYVGRRAGDAGLSRFIARDRFEKVRKRIKSKGAVAIAILDLVPPPFPFTAFILGAGALKVSTSRFFIWLAITRLIRFGGESVLAHLYGRHIINWLQSDTFEYIAYILAGVALLGTTLAVIQLFRQAGVHGKSSRDRAA